MNIRLQLPSVTDLKPRLAVIGVGGAGGNAVNNMIASGLAGVNFIVANTDAQALATSSAEQRIQLGVTLTEGLGAGSKPEIGQAAAEEALDEIKSQISGSHMVFIAAGMGGGTGTGAAAVIARVAKELDILTVGVVTKPFMFEGQRRMRIAEAGIAELRKYVDTLIVIPNQNLFRVANDKTTFAEAFLLADQVLYSGIACIVDLIVKEGLINLDFADVRTVMSGMGTAMMGTGEASGDRRAIRAAEEAIANPLLDDVSLRGAKGLLLSIIGGRDLTLYEVDEAAGRVREEVDAEANIIVGATFDESLGDRVRVSIVASGMAASQEPRPVPGPAPRPARTPQAPIHPQSGATASQGQRAPIPSDGFMTELSRAMNQDHGRGGATTSADLWRAPGGVVIKPTPPQLGQTTYATPPPHPQLERGRAPEPFTPAAPVEVKRSQRRMPALNDFPAHAQREFRAKAFADHASPGHESQLEAKRPGLLSRITGFARRTEQPSRPQSDDRMQGGRQAPSGAHTGGAHAGQKDPQREPSKAAEDVELPMFFHKDRQRQ